MAHWSRFCWLLGIVMVSLQCGPADSKAAVSLVAHGVSVYKIVVPGDGVRGAQRAAGLLRSLILSATGAALSIVPETEFTGSQGIFIGACKKTGTLGLMKPLLADGITIATKDGSLLIASGQDAGNEHAVAVFAERYMGCHKYDAGPAEVPERKDLLLTDGILVIQQPSFNYRESYYPPSLDPEYLGWHGLHRFESLWGLWGHSFFKLVPPAVYFKTHPEYFAEINGQRRATQLCLSQPQVLRLVIDALKARISENPDALYWSVSPNDGAGNCTCNDCRKADVADGGPQGSLLSFVNKVAAAFPGKRITTLAYGYTANAPLKTRPASNVYILLSSIDAYREQPLSAIASAAAFREQLSQWSAISKQIFVWDYATQFTRYLNPFPAVELMSGNYRYLREHGVSGVFEQGSGDTYSDMAELNSYVQARLLWDAGADETVLIREFCEGYYGAASPYVLQYLEQRRKALLASGRHLDIYGGPITDLKSFLSPELIDSYDQLLEKATAAVAADNRYGQRVQRIRLSLDDAVLQQSRHFGADEHGFLTDNGGPVLSIKKGWPEKVARFVAAAQLAGVRELSEGGQTPAAYGQEWQQLFLKKWPRNTASGASLSLVHPFVEDYPAKGLKTLTDGMTGFSDFSYNWLCFYGVDMVATIDMKTSQSFSTVSLNFLDDQRHWIYLPQQISIAVSADGITYIPFGATYKNTGKQQDAAIVTPFQFRGNAKARFIRVTAINAKTLPEWAVPSAKKPMIACDEIMVQP